MVQMLFSNLSLIAHKDSEQKKTLLKEKTDGTGEGVGDREGEEEEGTTAVLGVGGDSGSRDSLVEGQGVDGINEKAAVEEGIVCVVMWALLL